MSVIYAVLIDPFPYTCTDRIMQISLLDSAGRNRGTVSTDYGWSGLVILDRVAPQWLTESSSDPAVLGWVIALLVAIAGVACLVPARRAAPVDPIEALRYE